MKVNVQFSVSMILSCAVCYPNHDYDRQQSLEMVGQLNTLLSQPGWRCMDISAKRKYSGSEKRYKRKFNDTENGAVDKFTIISGPELLEVNLHDDHAVTFSNMIDKYRDILSVLECKYAEVITVYRVLISNLMEICLKYMYVEGNDFYEHFDVVLNKLDSISVTVRYMRDALKCYRNTRPIFCPQYSMLDHLLALEALTCDIFMKTKSKLNHYQNENAKYKAAIEEFKNIKYMFNDMTKKPWYLVTNNCLVTHQVFTPNYLRDDFLNKRINHLLSPSENTLWDYTVYKIDSYSGHIIKKWFYSLGFVYDTTRNPEEVAFNKDILS